MTVADSGARCRFAYPTRWLRHSFETIALLCTHIRTSNAAAARWAGRLRLPACAGPRDHLLRMCAQSKGSRTSSVAP